MANNPAKCLTYGEEGYAWLYGGLALLIVGKMLAVTGLLLLVTLILGQPVLPMFTLFGAAAGTIVAGVAANFQGLTMVTNRTQMKIVLGGSRMCVGTRWGLKTIHYAEIDSIHDEPARVRLELISGQTFLLPDLYFRSADQRGEFLRELRRRQAQARSLREPALFG